MSELFETMNVKWDYGRGFKVLSIKEYVTQLIPESIRERTRLTKEGVDSPKLTIAVCNLPSDTKKAEQFQELADRFS